MAVVSALCSSGPALDVWSHVVAGTEYDPWRDGWTVNAFPIAIIGAVTAVTTASVTARLGHHRFFLIVSLWAGLAVVALWTGLRVVRILPDG